MVCVSYHWGLLQTHASSEKYNTKSQVGLYQRKSQILSFLRKKRFLSLATLNSKRAKTNQIRKKRIWNTKSVMGSMKKATWGGLNPLMQLHSSKGKNENLSPTSKPTVGPIASTKIAGKFLAEVKLSTAMITLNWGRLLGVLLSCNRKKSWDALRLSFHDTLDAVVWGFSSTHPELFAQEKNVQH